MEKIIKTSCPFPLVKLDINLKYATVHKASGVGFIILVLIKEAKNRNELLCEVLKTFGVPDDLQFIFADELSSLIAKRILKLKSGSYQPEYFDRCAINHFSFTEDGERLFRDGTIPTGETKAKQVLMYFNPLNSDFLYVFKDKYMSIEKDDTFFPANFMDKVNCDYSRLKQFLIDNPSGLSLKKEEKVLDGEIKCTKNLFYKEENNLEIIVGNKEIKLNIRNKQAKEFYKKFYTPDMLERALAIKKKFVFSSVKAKKSSGFERFKNIRNLYLPEDYDKQTSHWGEFSLKLVDNKCILTAGKTELETEYKLPESYTFIAFDSNETKGIIPAIIELPESIHNSKLKINLVVEESIEDKQREKFLTVIFDLFYHKPFTEENGEVIKTITRILQKPDDAVTYSKAKLDETKEIAAQIDLLLEMKKCFKNQSWVDFARETVRKIYNSLFENLTEKNFAKNLKLAAKLQEYTNKKQSDIFEESKSCFPKFKLNEFEKFNLITESEFSVNQALSVSNIIQIYVNSIITNSGKLEKTVISTDFQALYNNLKEIKELVGIKSIDNYAFKQDYDKQKFIDLFRAFKANLNDLSKYFVFAKEGFAELEKYVEIMQPAFDFVLLERNASANPQQITEKYITEKINNGDYRIAISDLCIRLDFMLTKIVGIKEMYGKNLSDKIDLAKAKAVISKEDLPILHTLRDCRNQLQHPTNKAIKYNKENIELWEKTVFSIKETKEKPKNKEEKK
ncbi:MAG: hypothetical protein LBS01_12000 [Prevotellaceae bacterium]|jgi:hypothetical protein|nr:hypothetical protein [Prevotellaceae bacterium]